jgi:hypothetical protein
MHFSEVTDFGALIDGGWIYKDPEQSGVARGVDKILHWDLAAFDAWLFGQAHWRSFPKVRQQLIGLREQLTFSFRTHLDNDAALLQAVQDYFLETRRLAQRLDNLPTALRSAMLALLPTQAQPKRGKLDGRSTKRIQRLYQQMVESGQKYGAQTKLARQYGVSLTTLRKILQSPH